MGTTGGRGVGAHRGWLPVKSSPAKAARKFLTTQQNPRDFPPNLILGVMPGRVRARLSGEKGAIYDKNREVSPNTESATAMNQTGTNNNRQEFRWHFA